MKKKTVAIYNVNERFETNTQLIVPTERKYSSAVKSQIDVFSEIQKDYLNYVCNHSLKHEEINALEISKKEKILALILCLDILHSSRKTLNEMNTISKRRIVNELYKLTASKKKNVSCDDDNIPTYIERSTNKLGFILGMHFSQKINNPSAVYDLMCHYPDGDNIVAFYFEQIDVNTYISNLNDKNVDSSIHLTGSFESLCKLGKPEYAELYFNKFKDHIDINHSTFKFRPAHWTSLVTNFYDITAGTSSTILENYAKVNQWLEKELLIPETFRLEVKSDYTETTELSKADYLWLYCPNIPKMKAIFKHLEIDEPTVERKETLCVRHLLWKYPKYKDFPRSNLIVPIIKKLCNLYENSSS